MGLTRMEKLLLSGQTPFVKWLYEHGIREYMNYETGIVGVDRRISYQGMKEEMFVEPSPGVPKSQTGSPSTNRIIRAISRLVRIGLLRTIDDRPLVFECIHANRDNSGLNQVGARQVRQKGKQAGIAQTATKLAPTGDVALTDAQVGNLAIQHKNSQAGTPPLALLDNTNVLSKMSEMTVEAIFEEFFWVHWPKEYRARKREALNVYRSKKLYSLKETIRDDICLRKQKHKPWLAGFVPHPVTYLRGERWNDAIQESSGSTAYRRNSGKGGSIEAILDSCFERTQED